MTTTTTTSTPPDNTPTLHSSLIGKTTAQKEALCEEDSTLLGCTGILAAKADREAKAAADAMAKLKSPFGGVISFSRTAVGGSETTLTGMLGVEAIRQAGLEAKPELRIKDDGTRESSKYAAGAVFLMSSTGTAQTNKMLYGVHSGDIDRRPGGVNSTPASGRYNIFTKFTPTASGKYTVEVFHAQKSGGTSTRLGYSQGRNEDRNAVLQTEINTAYKQSGNVTSLAKLSPTGKNAYTEIGTLTLNDHLGLKADDKMFEGWSYNILSGKSKTISGGGEDATLYAEVWDNYGVSKTDYMVGGVWLLMPEDGDRTRTRFAAFAQTSSPYGKTLSNGLREALSGEATYKGLAAGFYVDDKNQVHRLLGKVTMNAEFDSVNAGTLRGTINGITLNGEGGNKGALTLNPQPVQGSSQVVSAPATSKDPTVYGTINGAPVMGDWSGMFTGPASRAGDPQPTGVIGTASGYSADESHTFAVSFGAKPSQ